MSVKPRRLRIVIIGAGPGGLCAAVKLKEAGFDDFVILEKAESLGGTWFYNTYPACACDLPSAIYSFSFDIKRDWSRPYAPQKEILGYLESIANKHDLVPHCRFGAEVRSAKWDEAKSNWLVELASGEQLEAEVVATALGMLNEPVIPQLEGLDTFKGKTFHSARWDWNYDLRGKNVAVVGSGASAVQFVPEIVKNTNQVHLFQRTANWIMPKEDVPYPQDVLDHYINDPNAAFDLRQQIHQGLDQSMTFAQEMVDQASRAVMETLEVIEDPAVREKLTPQDVFGCKRPLFSNNWYQAFNQPNLELVTDSIDRVTEDSIVTTDGQARAVDALIFATGFAASKFISVIDVVGRNGLSIKEAWKDGARAHLGITVSGFPNLFMMYGPNTNNGSVLVMHEAQANYAATQISRLVSEDLAWIDVHQDAVDRFSDQVQDEIKRIGVWTAGCSSYYQADNGRVVTQWPGTMTEYRERTEQPDADCYDSITIKP